MVAGLTAGYGGPPIVEGVDCVARRGAITADRGPNGAGKSTLLKAIAGVIRPRAGTVRVEGREVTGLASEKLVRQGIAYVPQVANVFPQLSVHENLEMGGYIRKHGVAERDRAALHALSRPAHRVEEAGRDAERGPAHHAGDGPGADGRSRCAASSTSPVRGSRPRFQSSVWERIEEVRATNVAVLIVEQNTRETLRHAQWAYVLVLGRNRLEGHGRSCSTTTRWSSSTSVT